MDKKELVELSKKIKSQLNIDIEKYKNEDVLLKFTEILIFPQYVFKLVIWPIIISLLAFILGFFILDLSILKLILYILLGPLLFNLTGLLFGVYLIITKIKEDFLSIINYIFVILKEALNDLDQIKEGKSIENLNQSINLLLTGVIQLVAIPMITKAVSNKIIFGSKIFNYLIVKILNLLNKKLDFTKMKVISVNNKKKSDILNHFSNSIDSISKNLENIISSVIGAIKYPITFILFFVSLTLMLFLICI